jgi:hypothetical protein
VKQSALHNARMPSFRHALHFENACVTRYLIHWDEIIYQSIKRYSPRVQQNKLSLKNCSSAVHPCARNTFWNFSMDAHAGVKSL